MPKKDQKEFVITYYYNPDNYTREKLLTVSVPKDIDEEIYSDNLRTIADVDVLAGRISDNPSEYLSDSGKVDPINRFNDDLDVQIEEV
jgi:hypothetical protein